MGPYATAGPGGPWTGFGFMPGMSWGCLDCVLGPCPLPPWGGVAAGGHVGVPLGLPGLFLPHVLGPCPQGGGCIGGGRLGVTRGLPRLRGVLDPCPLPPMWGAVDGGDVAQALWILSSSHGSLLGERVSRWNWYRVDELT